MRLANYVKNNMIEGRKLVTSLEDPKRKCIENEVIRTFKMVEKTFDCKSKNQTGMPWIVTVNEVDLVTDEVIRTFKFGYIESL